MNIALLGSGGREHVLCQKIYESKLSKNIICIPGNPGTEKIAKNIDLDFLNFKKLLKTIKSHKIDLVVVGPEEPLVRGIVDFLNKHKIKVFGPNKYAAKLEGSKAFMKLLCKKNNIPTADYKICKNIDEVNNLLKSLNNFILEEKNNRSFDQSEKDLMKKILSSVIELEKINKNKLGFFDSLNNYFYDSINK